MGDGMLSLYWNNHRATFCHILATLREKERYTDATIACDGKFYPVHKLVLSTCSEYFEKMFEHTPCKHPVIVLKDIKADALEALLSYMYAGYVNVAQNDLARLIKAAETLSIKGLAVPDEPPLGEENKPNQTKSVREERLSPQPKRRRREENGSSQPSTSPPSSPRASSPFQADSEHFQPRSRTHSESHRTDRIEPTEQPLDHPPSDSQPSDVKVMVDESLVKEEMVETVDNSQAEAMDTGLQYGAVGSEPGMDSGGGGEDHSSHMVPNKYDQPVIPGQPQSLPDAVAEALAGPSGMQGWLGGSELPGPGGYSAETYGGDGSQDVQPGGAHAHQRESERGSEAPPPAKVGSTELPVLSAHLTCPYCFRATFRQNSDLKRHIRIHTGEKPYKCKTCVYRASRKDLLQFGSVDSEGLMLKCSYCGRDRFRSEYYLNRHMLTHTGERPYPCSACRFRAARRDHLDRHIKRVHSNLIGSLKMERHNTC